MSVNSVCARRSCRLRSSPSRAPDARQPDAGPRRGRWPRETVAPRRSGARVLARQVADEGADALRWRSRVSNIVKLRYTGTPALTEQPRHVGARLSRVWGRDPDRSAAHVPRPSETTGLIALDDVREVADALQIRPLHWRRRRARAAPPCTRKSSVAQLCDTMRRGGAPIRTRTSSAPVANRGYAVCSTRARQDCRCP